MRAIGTLAIMAFTAVIAFAKQKDLVFGDAGREGVEPIAASLGLGAAEDAAADLMRLLVSAPVPASAWLAMGALSGALFLGALSRRRA